MIKWDKVIDFVMTIREDSIKVLIRVLPCTLDGESGNKVQRLGFREKSATGMMVQSCTSQ